MALKKISDHLLVVAHPDDETLFFGGLLQQNKSWHVACVTDGNADGLGKKREQQFLAACRALKVRKAEMFKLPDVFDQRLNTGILVEKLRSLGKFKKVFTHGILGEYGHNHHQDVSYATHQTFARETPVYSVAYNTFPDFKISLTREMFAKKNKILWNIYEGEIKRLINFLPSHSTEGFVKVSLSEVEVLYAWLNDKTPLQPQKIKRTNGL